MEYKVRHGETVGYVVETVNLGHDSDSVEVLNRGSFDLYFRLDGSDPVVDGNNSEIVPVGSALEVLRVASGNATVKLISEDDVKYSVRGIKR